VRSHAAGRGAAGRSASGPGTLVRMVKAF
jgi:hypothetical protein